MQKLKDEKTNQTFYLFACPHCGGAVQVLENEVNCTIFRHAVLKANGQQISPHTPKAECDRLDSERLVEGCAKPFRLNVPCMRVEICDYI